jgi:hypothetical protein
MSRPQKTRLDQIQKRSRVNITAATLTLSELRHGDRQNMRLNLAAGQALLLPYATGKGGMYRIFVETTITGSTTLKVAQTNNPKTGIADVIYGVATTTGSTPGTFAATANGTITMNGSTQGGLKGSYIEIEDVDVGIWRVEANMLGSGTTATCFS